MNAPDTPPHVCGSLRTRFPVRAAGAMLALLAVVGLAGCGEEPASLEELRAMQARGAFATTLFVTSCSLDDTVDADAKSLSASEPTAGAVFALDVGVKGVAVHAAAF